jgi:hypothetical protein
MKTLADRRLAQLSTERDSRVKRALALEARGLPVSARQQMVAALAAQQRIELLKSLMNRRHSTVS